MSHQMSFIYAKHTGHVLSFVTTAAAASPPPTAADLASPTLLVRDVPISGGSIVPGLRFDLAPDLLDVFTGDVIDAALIHPRSYFFDGQAVQPSPSSALGTLTVDSSGVTVDLGSNANVQTNILVAYSGSDPTKSETATGNISAGAQKTTIPAGPLASGTYVLVLVSGFAPAAAQVT